MHVYVRGKQWPSRRWKRNVEGKFWYPCACKDCGKHNGIKTPLHPAAAQQEVNAIRRARLADAIGGDVAVERHMRGYFR
jgi:hypothetical protein